MPSKRTIGAGALLALLAGCAAPQTPERESEAEPRMTIRGSLAFRDSVTPPPGSVATVTVRAFGDDAAEAVASTTAELESGRIIVPFELEAPLSRFDPSRQYAVTARVSGAGDEGRWTTDVAQLIDVTQQVSDVGVLLMTRAPQERDRD